MNKKKKEFWTRINCAGCGKQLGPHLTRPDAKIYCQECCCPMCVAEKSPRALEPPVKEKLHEINTRLAEARKLWHEDFVEAYNGGTLTAQGREILRKRIAELSAQAKEIQ